MFLSSLFGQSNVIYTHTEKQQYYAGELVVGQVILSVVEPIHVNGVYLKVRGDQEAGFDVTRETKVQDPANEKHQITKFYQERVSESRKFFQRRYCIYAQKCTLSGGNFVFPFQFQLEAKLPGTFEIYNSSQYSRHLSAKVSYQVEAEVAVPGMLRHSQDILIHEPLRATLASTETFKETNVTFCCCIPKGRVSMSANIDQNAYRPGATVKLRLIVDNSQSRVDLEALSLKLVRTLQISARGETLYESRTVAKVKSPGVSAGDRAERYIQLDLPTDSEPSTKAPLISCSYVLSVELKVPWSPDVVIRQPVQIFAPQRATYVAQLHYPPDWQPSVFPVSDLEKMQYTAE